ncbi:MAG: toll/interleukin-1 receptor domain-containing protein, partial [Saprospiraceae bacterium]|nr:toll/interleukin-1 receptor domain-containing protein [Saprospiraceae bacterium]
MSGWRLKAAQDDSLQLPETCAKAAEPHFYDHEKLQRRRMDGKRTVECDLSYEDVSVSGLLDGVFAKHIPVDPIEIQPLKSIETMKKIFISYSKSDKIHLDEFKKQLSPLRRLSLMETWDDSHIQPGEEWDKAIKRELKSAHIIVLLISADLINTDYIWDVEMKEALNVTIEGGDSNSGDYS